MIQIPDFAHHTINLLLPSLEQAGAAGGGKALLPVVKEACKLVRHINGSVKNACRTETALVVPNGDFFAERPGLANAKRLVWDSVRDAARLRWIVLCAQAAILRKALPDHWPTNGYPNVCVGLVLEHLDDLSETVRQLRSIPARWKMLLLPSLKEPIDLCGKLDGIHWVVTVGTLEDEQRAGPIKEACKAAGAAFHFHRNDCGTGPENTQQNANSDLADGDEPPWPDHPFGSQVKLHLPTLSELHKAHDTIHAPAASAATDAGTLPNDSMMKMPQVELPPAILSPASPVDPPLETPTASAMASTETHTLEVVQSTADADKRAILHADRTDFEHLDKVVRDGLKTFIDVGNALLEIRQRELWRAGGHATWAAYCQQVGGFTKIHANRLIKGSLLAKQLAQVKPAGFRSEAITPRSEWQIRPLYRLEDDRQRAEAWHRAIERAGGQPTAEMVQEAAIEIGGSAPSEENPKPNRKQLLVETFGRLRASILSRKPSKDIEVLISELERLLKLT